MILLKTRVKSVAFNLRELDSWMKSFEIDQTNSNKVVLKTFSEICCISPKDKDYVFVFIDNCCNHKKCLFEDSPSRFCTILIWKAGCIKTTTVKCLFVCAGWKCHFWPKLLGVVLKIETWIYEVCRVDIKNAHWGRGRVSGRGHTKPAVHT